jgi:hypothetical protein
MFRAKISCTVKISGCPEAGLVAVKFREAVGLPPAPTGLITLEYDRSDVDGGRGLCDLLPDLLDAEADLFFTSGEYPHSRINERIAVAPEDIVLARCNTPEGLAALAGIIRRIAEVRAADAQAKADEQVERALAVPVHSRLEYTDYRTSPWSLHAAIADCDDPRLEALQLTLADERDEKNAVDAAERAARAAACAARTAERKAEEARAEELGEALDAEALAAATASWLIRQTAETQERHERGFVSSGEIINWAREQAFAPLEGRARYKKLESKDICECEYDICSCEYKTTTAETLSAESFASLREVESLMPSARVTARDHVGTSDACECEVTRESILVEVRVAGTILSREYAV